MSSLNDLQKARETRAAEALKMKDEQIHLITTQNSSLQAALYKVRLQYCTIISGY